MTRDYLAEMRAVIDAETADDPYESPVIAAQIVEKLRQTDPDLLAGYLDLHAVTIVKEAINQIDRSTRTRAREVASRSVFAKAADWAFTDEQWALLWLTGEQNGIGASRSQGFGRYEVTRWDRLT